MNTNPPIWRYELVWSPHADEPTFRLIRRSDQGHVVVWSEAPAPEVYETPAVEHVLEEFYSGLLKLLELTC